MLPPRLDPDSRSTAARAVDFSAVVEHGADAACLLDQHGIVLYASDAIARMVARTATDLIGQNILDLVHAEDRPDVERRTTELLGCPGEYLRVLARVGEERGGWRWADATVTNLLEHERVGALVVTLRDVTHERRLAAAIASSEDRLRRSTEAAELGTWSWDLQTNLVSWTYPHPLLAAQGDRSGTKPPDRLLAYLHPEDSDLLNIRIEQAMIRGRLEARFRAAWPGAGTRWFAASGRVSYSGSRPARMTGTVRDITSTGRADGHALLLATLAEQLLQTAKVDGHPVACAARNIAQHLAADHCFFGQLDAATGTIREWLAHPRNDAQPGDARRLCDLPEPAPAELCAGNAVAINECTAAASAPLSGCAFIAVPHLSGGRLELVMFVCSRTPRVWDADEIALAVSAAGLVYRAAAQPGDADAPGASKARAEERGKLARELHDQMAQYITALSLALEPLEQAFGQGTPGACSVDTLRALISRIAAEVHRVAVGLRPPLLDELGLAAAVGEHVERWGSETGVVVDFLARNVDGVESNERSTALYRIIQEALTNVARHARASRVGVILEQRDGFLTAIVEDNGVGFDLSLATGARAALSLGLLGMRERADALGGMVTVESTPGTGTTIFARIPVAAP